MPKRSEPALPSLLPGLAPEPAAVEREVERETQTGIETGDNAVARFEQDMQELESIVAQMEKGDLRLEDSLKLFERGTQLARSSRLSLDTAELKVRKLLDEADASNKSSS